MTAYKNEFESQVINEVIKIGKQIEDFVNIEVIPNIYQNITVIYDEVFYFKIGYDVWRNTYAITYGCNYADDNNVEYRFPITINCYLDLVLHLIENWPNIRQEILKQMKIQQERLIALRNFKINP